MLPFHPMQGTPTMGAGLARFEHALGCFRIAPRRAADDDGISLDAQFVQDRESPPPYPR